MAVRSSSQSGAWTSTATWGGLSAPVITDDVTINTGHTVTANDDRACNTLFIDMTGILELASVGGSFTCIGNIDISGTFRSGNDQRVKVLIGGEINILTGGIIGTTGTDSNINITYPAPGTGGYPAESDVRDGVDYGRVGEFEGTLETGSASGEILGG